MYFVCWVSTVSSLLFGFGTFAAFAQSLFGMFALCMVSLGCEACDIFVCAWSSVIEVLINIIKH